MSLVLLQRIKLNTHKTLVKVQRNIMYIFIYKFYFKFKLFFTHINIYFLFENILRIFLKIERFLNLHIHIKLMTFKK